MSWCISHSSHAFNIVEIICMSFDNPTTIPIKKVCCVQIWLYTIHSIGFYFQITIIISVGYEIKMSSIFVII